ncbi:adenylyltransferase/cytidyltransferase family protein [Mycobacterium sp.]|uniref:adenylyltransferase/cytidyltransferase family protein n=1 Tax=Mycobacterium sp. TaxID=1785 RepID=UPI003BAE2C69
MCRTTFSRGIVTICAEAEQISGTERRPSMVENDRPSAQRRIYVDMVGDLFHMGHVGLLKAARECGDWLIVGVLSDEVASSYKRRPIMKLAERVTVIEACRYVDEVIPNAPYRLTTEFLEEHDVAMVVHGDDIAPDVIADIYGAASAADKLKLVSYTAGISTTDLIRRVQERASSCRPMS